MKILALLAPVVAVLLLAQPAHAWPFTKKTEAKANTTESIANNQNLNVQKITSGQQLPPPANLTISGGGDNKVDILYTGGAVAKKPLPGQPGFVEQIDVNSHQDGGTQTHDVTDNTSDIHLPLGFALLAVALGLAALVWAWRYATRSSAALAAANAAANDIGSNLIGRAADAIKARMAVHQSIAAKSTNPVDTATHLAEVVNLQSIHDQITALDPGLAAPAK